MASARFKWVVLGMLAAAPGASAGEEESPIDFGKSILPLLREHCVSCHGAEKQKGGLRLDSKSELMRGGDSGKVLSPRDAPGSSLLARLTTRDEDERMPQGKPALSQDKVELIRRWIELGALGDDPTGTGEMRSSHWAFQPVRDPPAPDGALDGHPIDRFVLARLKNEGLAPSPEADRFTLLRRLSFDLTGLPPSVEEVDSFLSEARPGAYERLVDRLLASPHFGEQFANHWLDLARYGDSDGFEQDAQRPNAYRWRDWVIEAINVDMPFDQFTIEQLAGDLLPEATDRQKLATAFHRNTPTNREGGIDQEEARVRTIVDRVNTTGTVWLGLTIGCAECHSHKFDLIRQGEFYQLYAFFNDAVEEADLPLPVTEGDLRQHEADKEAREKRLQSLRAQLETATGQQKEDLERMLNRLTRQAPAPPQPAMPVFRSSEKTRQSYVHKGGDYKQRGVDVAPGTPGCLPPMTVRGGPVSPADRLDLARWLVDRNNPLTPRVEANRLWQYLFGAGLVATPDDFGTQGEAPTHPELLDHLASKLMELRWSRKAMIRYIVTSSTYRQASRRRADLEKIDPNNRLLARQNRVRLSAELVRDAYFAVGGLLDKRVGGPGIRPELPEGFKDFAYRLNWNPDKGAERYRRGMYIFFQRNMVFPMLRTFDRSDSNVTCVRRERSNTPLQALTQLNDREFMEAAAALGRRLMNEAPVSEAARVEHAFRLCYGRPVTDRERGIVGQLLRELRSHFEASPTSAEELSRGSDASPEARVQTASWVALARVLMNTDEFITRE